MRPLLSLTGSFQQRKRWQRLVAVLHDGVARARARRRPRLTSGLRDMRGGCAADMAAATRILALPFRGVLQTLNEVPGGVVCLFAQGEGAFLRIEAQRYKFKEPPAKRHLWSLHRQQKYWGDKRLIRTRNKLRAD